VMVQPATTSEAIIMSARIVAAFFFISLASEGDQERTLLMI
jgi:hypothetical protein